MSGLQTWANSGKDISKQAKLDEGLKQCEKGFHTWSIWFSVPAGLARECLFCHKIQRHPKHNILNRADAENDFILEDLKQ